MMRKTHEHGLVGGIPTPLKNMSSSVGIILPNIWKVINLGFSIYKTPIHVPLILVSWDYSQYGKVIIHSMVPVTTNQLLIIHHY
jgi:hypothetical protein